MSKLALSPAEISVICDQSFLMHKVSIGKKINQLFRELKSGIAQVSVGNTEHFPPGLDLEGGKISHGENYHGLAWRVLDYPAKIQKPDIFMFRTMMLWGEGFFFHLILQGDYLVQLSPRIIAQAATLGKKGWKLSLQGDVWDWSYNKDSHGSLSGHISHLQDPKILKISQRFPLTDFSEIDRVGTELWRDLLHLLLAPNP